MQLFFIDYNKKPVDFFTGLIYRSIFFKVLVVVLSVGFNAENGPVSCISLLHISNKQMNRRKNIPAKFQVFRKEFENKFTYLRRIAGYSRFLRPVLPEMCLEYFVTATRVKIRIDAILRAGKVYYYGECSSPVFSGVLGIFFDIFSGRAPEDILYRHCALMDDIRRHNQLSSKRRNDLLAILEKTRMLAVESKLKVLFGALVDGFFVEVGNISDFVFS